MRIGIGTSIVGQQVFSAKQYLDDIAGTPTAAYSVRKVVSTYTDPVVEVRRTVSAVTVEADVSFDGDTITLDSPVTITSGSSSATTLGQFVADAGYTDVDSLGSAQDAFVATWYDQAGSNDATQTTANDQPKIYDASTGLVTENGQVALDFDGTDDYLDSGIPAQDTTVFSVSKCDGTDDSQDAIFGSFETGKRLYLSFNWTSNTHLWGYGTAANAISPDFTDQVLSVYNGYQKTGHINSQKQVDFTGSEDYPSFNVFLGSINNSGTSSGLLDGTIQELIIYTADKSSDRTDIEGNIASYFGITLS